VMAPSRICASALGGGDARVRFRDTYTQSQKMIGHRHPGVDLGKAGEFSDTGCQALYFARNARAPSAWSGLGVSPTIGGYGASAHRRHIRVKLRARPAGHLRMVGAAGATNELRDGRLWRRPGPSPR
jgi:hypothetical protein